MADCLILIGISLFVIFATFVVVAYLIVVERVFSNFLCTGTWPKWSGLSGLLKPLREFVTQCRRSEKTLPGWNIAFLGEWLTITGAIFPLVVLPLLQSDFLSESGRFYPVSFATECKVDLLLVTGAWIVGLLGCVLREKTIRHEAGSIMAILVATMGVISVSGSLDLDEISLSQMWAGVWWGGVQPLGLAAFLAGVASLCVGGRAVSQDQSAKSDECVDRLRLVVSAYLAVGLFFGGWHDVERDGVTFAGQLFDGFALHLKALLFMAVVVWCRARAMVTIGFRLPSGLWRFAFVLGGVNLVVVLLQEQFLGPGEWLLKSATNWITLAVCLSAASLVLDRENVDA